jgi:NAD(P)-dependent dehydrogenase (short-subunit alcohol dehydrogenase family)
VLVACADVTDLEAMRGVVEETLRRFGALNGVVHAAGVLRDAPILAKIQDEVEEVFAPKVHGTLVLDAVLRDVDLDFLLLYSSVSAITAPAGQVDYVAASAFLDAYARSASDGTHPGQGAEPEATNGQWHESNGRAHATNGRLRGARRRRTVAVNWGVWGEVGMAAAALTRARPVPAAAGSGMARHPLFESRSGDPDAPLVLEARWSPETHWILGEHRTLDGRPVVPGSAFLEMARAALVEADERPVFEIRDLLFLRPLHVPDGSSRDVQVELRPNVEGYRFSVRSRGGDPDTPGPWETHAQARLLLRVPKDPGPVPIAEIEARCPARRTAAGTQTLASRQEELVRFGPRWRTLREVRLGSGEALATLELDPAFAADREAFGLHPALLDIATTCGLELFERSGDPVRAEKLWVPISYKSIRVHAPLAPRVRSWVRSRDTNRADAQVLLFDVTVVGEDGQVCLEIEEFAMRRLAGDLDLSPAPEAEDSRATPRAGRRPRSETFVEATPSPGRAALQRNFERGIGAEEGMEAFTRILAAPGLSQVVATSLDLEGLRRQAGAIGAPPDAGRTAHARPDLGSEFVEPPDGIERTLAGFWQELLGVQSSACGTISSTSAATR